MEKKLDSIEDVIQDIKKGKLVIVMDSKKRENEGDFIGAAKMVTPSMINFMLSYARGAFIAVFMQPGICDSLEIPPMLEKNDSFNVTNFRVSVDAKTGKSGSSAFDRAKTVTLLADPLAKPEDFVRPGHVIPIEAHSQGLLKRQGHTEAGVALVQLAGFNPAVAVDLEILDDDGTMAKEEKLFSLASRMKMKITNIESILDFLKQ
jgi:3,4-dihydroxy 2-butanone 4-phosphate synthase/GTP cyclohydrolase II